MTKQISREETGGEGAGERANNDDCFEGICIPLLVMQPGRERARGRERVKGNKLMGLFFNQLIK